MIVRVLQTHIDRGSPCAPSSCPIALALEDQTGQPWNVGRYSCIIADDEPNNDGSIPLPEIARSFVRSFDWGNRVYPFSFELPDPPVC
jgi:hypothetical protein